MIEPMDWPSPEVIHYTMHYDVVYIPPADEKTYPRWEIVDRQGVVLLALALNLNYNNPVYQAKEICEALEQAYQDGLFDS